MKRLLLFLMLMIAMVGAGMPQPTHAAANLHGEGPYYGEGYVSGDVYKTVLRIDASHLPDAAHKPQAKQWDPSRTCRMRTMYRIHNGSDYPSAESTTLNNTSGWTAAGAMGHGGVYNAVYYDIQVRCGPSFYGLWAGVIYIAYVT